MGARLRTGAATLAVVVALALAGTPAVAAGPAEPGPRVSRDRDGSVGYTDPALADEDVERVRGRLQVVVVEGTGRHGDGSRTEHAVEVADGSVVPLDLDVPRLAPGASVVADVVAGPDLAAALDGRPQDPVAVESASVVPVAAATTATPSAHRAYVAVLSDTGSLDPATVAADVDTGLGYWATESDGAVTSFTRPAATAVYDSALSSPCSFGTSADAVWNEAAAKFPGVDFSWTGGGNHLIVVVADSCTTSVGLGTVGTSLAAGGKVLMTDARDTFTSTLTHELGHNVGLQHANLDCSCDNGEYWDLYSPMALALSGGGTFGPGALDAEYRDQLGITTSGEVEDVRAAGTTTRTLQPRGSGSGLRSLRVVAPDGRVHWVEARLGGGRDAGTFVALRPTAMFSASPTRSFGQGVTISTDEVGDGTPSLLRPRSDGTTLRGARTAGHSFTEGDVTVAVTSLGTSSATVSVTIAGPAAPAELEAGVPTISGTPAVGSVLTRQTGTWTSGATLATQWLVDGVEVPGATGATFTPAAGHVDGVVSVRVDGSKAGHTSRSATSAPTAAVAPGTFTGPAPTVSGTPRVGVALTSTLGTWPAGTTLAREWVVEGAVVGTGETFTPTSAHVGRPVTLRTTATRPGYVGTSRTSSPTASVLAGILRWTTPTVSGTRKVGRTLTAVRGTWTTGTTFSHQWYAGTTAIRGATASTFRLTSAQAGKKVRVRVVGRKAGYTSVTKYSAYTGSIAR